MLKEVERLTHAAHEAAIGARYAVSEEMVDLAVSLLLECVGFAGDALERLGHAAPGAAVVPAAPHDTTPPPAAMGGMNRVQLLEQARQVICERGRAYGDPDVFFGKVAEHWTSLLGRTIAPHEVILCMVALKLARCATDATLTDSWVDIAGYSALGVELATGGLF